MVSAALGTGRRFSLARSRAGALLCVALMVVTAWAVLAGGWVVGGGGAVVVAVTAVLEAALLARAAVPRLVAVLVVPLLALAAIVPTTLAALPFDGDASLGHTAARYAGALFAGLATNTDWTFTVGLCAVLWACGYWLGWVALREHRGVLAVLPLYAVLATNVLNAKSSELIGLPETIAVFLSLLVIAQVHLDSLQSTWRVRSVSPLSGTRSRFAASVTVAATGLTLLALLIPPVSTADISGRFFPGKNGQGGSANPITQPELGPGTIQFNPVVQPGGALKSTPRQVLVYSSDSTSQTYLRMVDSTVFSAGNWSPRQPNSGADDPTSIFDALAFSAGPLPRDRNLADGGVGSAEQAIHTSIAMDPAASGNTGLIAFAGEPDALDRSGSAVGTVVTSQQGLVTVDGVQVQAAVGAGITFTTTGLVPTASAEQLRHASTDYPAFVAAYTRLPDYSTHGAAVIRSLAAQWTAGTTNSFDAATAIETRLRDPKNFTYTLSPPAPSGTQWPIVYFLVTSHRGYCQYFASSMGALLRSVNIPTRLVVGYGPGTPLNEAPQVGSRRIGVSTSDAHVWVEAYFPGYGWIPFEPTPPSNEGDYFPFPRGGSASTSQTNTPSPPPTSPLPSLNPNAASGLGNDRNHGIPGAVTGLVWAAGSSLILALLAIVWLLVPRSLAGAWFRIEALGAWAGVRRRPCETYREYAERLGAVRPRGTAPLDAIAVALGRAVYSKDGAGGRDAEALRGWRKLVFALARARRLLPRRRLRPLSPWS
jgi:transglutaminase superfamily protein/transglutaminase TgpA-like protein/uncharacterized protein DUF4129